VVFHIITAPVSITRSDAVTPTPNTREPVASDHAVEQVAASSTFRVLDVEGLINRCMGNIDLVQRVLEKFQQRIPDELAELEDAFEHGETERLGRIAHRLRGSSATVSAEGFAQAAAEIEDASRNGRVADIPAGIEHLRSEWRRLAELPSDLLVGK
jgi:HPt (histidine-containing phosphotransfer) domain-containing protein